ncbi:hypothetical protein Gotri_024005 [Gossypium trilobum]|uniref:DUF7745 domain-containing protein n=1 Tax=Gossypium trilobum TaxID=34281 RepID=A0A7J9DKR5_9ROSI|nr:hypothetical protein [Gossypium trilobum]
MNITGMSEQWVVARIKHKGDSKCILWKNLKDLILAHPNTKKKVDVFALSVYGLVVFPKALSHVDEAITDLFDRLDKRVTPVPTILAETFRSLNECRRAGEGRFIGCVQLLLAWFYSGMISRRKNGWKFFRIFKERISNGEFIGCFQMRSYIDVVTTPEYIEWWGKRINDNIPGPSQ